MKTFLILLLSFFVLNAYSQLNIKKTDSLAYVTELKIDFKPKPRFKKDNSTKNAVLAGGIIFGSILTANHFADYKKENNVAYFGLMSAIAITCTVVIIIK